MISWCKLNDNHDSVFTCKNLISTWRGSRETRQKWASDFPSLSKLTPGRHGDAERQERSMVNWMFQDAEMRGSVWWLQSTPRHTFLVPNTVQPQDWHASPKHPRRSGASLPDVDVRAHHQVPHCVQTPPLPPIQGQSEVSFRGFGTLFSKYEQTMQWICYEKPFQTDWGLITRSS